MTPPFNVRLEIAGDNIADVLGRAPARPAVAVFESAEGRAVLVAATGDLRALLKRRLLDQPAEGSPTRRVDLRTPTARVRAITVGGAFEAESIWLGVARDLLPHVHRAVSSRWQGWFVGIDPDAEHPRWMKVVLPGWTAGREGAPSGASGMVLGPFRDKHAAGRFIETMDDLFDLCRFHHILVQTPNGTACAYKEMGKCPAPCDGSESLPAYRSRVRAAADFATKDRGWQKAEAERRMQEAATGLDFERAAEEHAEIQRVEALSKPGFRSVRRMEDMRWVVIAPSERRGWARVLFAAAGQITAFADVQADRAREALADLAPALARFAASLPAFDFEDASQELLGLACARSFRPAGRGERRERFIACHGAGPLDLPVREILSAIRQIGRARADESEEVDGAVEVEAT